MRRRVHGLRSSDGIALLACVHALGACTVAQEPDYAAQPQYPGLFTPGSELGKMAREAANGGPLPDASMGQSQAEQEQMVEQGITEVEGQNRCLGYVAGALAAPTEGAPAPATPVAPVMTRGSLTVQFTTQPLGQHKTYTPTNVGAVWIEDAAKNHIKTLNVWADERLPALFVWRKRGCSRLEVDAISGATRVDHSVGQMATWTGDDLHGTQVPDGTYRLNIEVTETEGDYSKWSEIEFQKGPQPFDLMIPDHPAHMGLRIAYVPMP